MIESLTAGHPVWQACVDHLVRHDMARWALDDQHRLLPDCHLMGAIQDGDVVGHITLLVQPVASLQTEWSVDQGYEHTITAPGTDTPLLETLVHTFAVDVAYRRQGIGRALQLAALDWTREHGCYQMRSWSSLDKVANYALKLSLGFGVYPATQVSGQTGQTISGVYFVKVVG